MLRYILAARAAFGDAPEARFIQATAAQAVAAPATFGLPTEDAIWIFPFNVLGILPYPEGLLKSLADAGATFIVSGFGTSAAANYSRHGYYTAAGFWSAETRRCVAGVRMTSTSGLNTMAYSDVWFGEVLAACGGQHYSRAFCSIGLQHSNRPFR